MEMLYTKETFNSKDEWLNHRGIGGSSASAIMGCNPYMSILDLYRAILFPETKKVDEQNEATLYGTQCEDLIRQIVALNFKNKFDVHKPENYEMYRRIDKQYLTASLDGIMTDKDTKEKYVLEIKTHDVYGIRDLDEWDGRLPQNYFIQCCHYLNVMNDFKGAILVAKLRYFNFRHEVEREEIRYYKIEREEVKDSLINLENSITNFWNNHIVKKIVPPIQIKF